MNHRPLCAAAAVALLVAALGMGNPFRTCCRTGDGRPDPARSGPLSPVPLVTPASFGGGAAGSAGGAAVLLQGDLEVEDEDGVGPCPEPGLARVVRRGRDADGWATWWHADGSITKRGVRQVGGELLPFVMRLQPSQRQQGAAVPAASPVAGRGKS